MPRVHFVKCARKDVPNSDIKKGESYYWWKFRFGGKRVSREYPKPQQLTQSAFLQSLYDIQEQIGNAPADDGLASWVEDIVSQLEDLKSECENSLENMPEGLRDTSDSGMMLQERIDALDNAISEFENVEVDDFEPRTEDPDDKEMAKELEDEGLHLNDSNEVCNADDEPLNEDGQTEAEYWDSKAEEVNAISVDV